MHLLPKLRKGRGRQILELVIENEWWSQRWLTTYPYDLKQLPSNSLEAQRQIA